MKGQMRTGWRILTVLFASAALGAAQVNSMSAPAAPLQGPNYYNNQAQPPAPVGPGTINYVEGQVSLNGQPLSARSVGTANLRPGEVLDTGNGYVEVLLTPGAFLRVGPNSEVRLNSAGLANTGIDLARGSAMVEVDQIIKGTNLSISMNGATTRLEEKGIYDFNGAEQAVRVLDGKASVVAPSGTQSLKKHDVVLLASGHPLKKQRFDEKAIEAEPLYVWSKARSQDEAQANMGAASNPDLYASAGPGWYWDPYSDFYGFYPAAGFLYSPFGLGFYSPAYFGYYGGGYYGGGRGWYGHGHPGHGWHGHVSGMNARVGGVHGARGFHSGGGFHGSSGFHGGMGGGFHGGGGGFHGGGGGHH